MDAQPAATGGGLDKAPLDQVLATLGVKPDQGLTAAEAASRLAKYGPNGIAEHEEPFAQKVLRCFVGPIAFMIEAAAVVSAILGHWPDFVIIARPARLQRRPRPLAGHARRRTRWPR